MDILLLIISGICGLLIGAAVAYFLRQSIATKSLKSVEEKSALLIEEAKAKHKEMLLEAKEEALKVRSGVDNEYRERRLELQKQERRLVQKEENLDRKVETMEKRERALLSKEKDINSMQQQVEELRQKEIKQLEIIAGMSTNEAKEFLLKKMDQEIQEDVSRRIRLAEQRIREESGIKATEILSQAIQRCATDVVTETTVSVVPIPSDDMKGRLIGREGRNIRALEHATGVDLIIDDTPESVTISCFDPIRREVARVALSKLILDGRIHPARIEEVVNKARQEVEATIKSEGEKAIQEVRLPGIYPELIKLLGKLKFRFSYGQNVLLHSIEVAQLAGMIAAELRIDVNTAKKAGLLHDIGKAVDHEVEGPHATIGADLVKQWEKSPEVVRAIAEHHLEAETISVMGFIISTADAISGGRPGARRESLEQYLKRLDSLENIANSFKGVEKSYAIQAGREVRIMVKPEEIDDMAALRLARDIAKKVEETLEYPGQIKVTVIRETRVIDYAK